MKQVQIKTIVFGLILLLVSVCSSAEPREPFLRDLTPGLYLKSSTEISSVQTRAIGRKLGGDIERLTNSIVQVHGRLIQVNVITASDDTSAKLLFAAISKFNSHPFCLKKGRVIIEYVGKNIDEALAIKTSYELGLLEKPDSVRYRVNAKLATIEKADYMACNPLSNQLLAARNSMGKDTIQQVNDLSLGFKFGPTLILRNPKLFNESAAYQFEPVPFAMDDKGSAVSYSFDQLPILHGIPYVNVTMEITVDSGGLFEMAQVPTKTLSTATRFWPADDADVIALAQKITCGKTINSAKALAILDWLVPGKNIKYSGQTGSRWGTARVIEQKFGHCWDFSDCFVTLARAVGVPSRQVAGWVYGSSGHVWAEYYREGLGWQQVDPTGGGNLSCGIYHIPYFTSENGEMPVLYVSMPSIEVVQWK